MTSVLVVPGDGVGPSVVDAARRALKHLAPELSFERGQAGRDVLAEQGTPLAPETRRRVEEGRADAVLFGATQTREGEPSAVLALREAAGARASLRPGHVPSASGASRVDVRVLRELTQGLYVQDERDEGKLAVARRPVDQGDVEAFAEIALSRVPEENRIVTAHKATVLPETDGRFRSAIETVAERQGRTVDDRLVDALAHDLARGLGQPTAILAPNLYGDVLSDLVAGLGGGLGQAGSITLGEGPPIAEPVHGTAPDVDPERANPTGALRSAALLLEELGHARQARALDRALAASLEQPGPRTPDQGGNATTLEFADAVLARLEVPA